MFEKILVFIVITKFYVHNFNFYGIRNTNMREFLLTSIPMIFR